MATSAPITWDFRDPDLWPSIAQASALLLSLVALARLREHLALTVERPVVALPETTGRTGNRG